MVNKMKTVRKIELGFYLMVLNLWSFTLVAQDEDPGFPAEDPGTPAAPIDNWLMPMFVVGVVLVYYIYRRQSTVTP